ncbi:glycosyltransferase family 2 protein [Pseudalkalibacillus sp. Hm43]|uniref:glycosyltransferase family 2 protein n=1 Tax=Pseudalkalibacillus sp. Hm43 TaxID=3450742 RepID=UPI003F442A60
MNTANPKVSIIIPFYNCSYVHHAINSALRQTYQPLEIIVVDDGSTLNQHLITPFKSRIKYIYKKNGGTATALNRGIQESSGDLIAWLSSDDVFLRNKLRKQVDFMKKTGADMVYSNFNLINERSIITRRNAGLYLERRLDFLKMLTTSCPINGNTVLFKKSLIDEVGLFDESLKYTQDYDMWIRMACKTHIKMLNEALINYRHHDKMGSRQFHEEQWREIRMIQEKYKGMVARLIHCEESGKQEDCYE